MKKQNRISHIALHTSQKGITLIALIITIIVMLILVGVTINVALNGGLFDKAEYASKQMQIKAEEEELLSAVVAAIGNDGKIKFREIELPEGWEGVAEKTFKSPKENIYEVDDYGKITYKGKNTGGGNTLVAFNWKSVGLKVDTNAEYAISTGGTMTFSNDGKIKVVDQNGKTLFEIDATISENIKNGKIDCQVTVNGFNTNAKITMNEEDENDEKIYAEVQGLGTIICEKIQDEDENENKDKYTNEQVLKMLGITNSTGTYTGTWTVLEKDADGNPTKLVSASDVTSYTFGIGDPRATGASDLEKSIWSYKNAVNSLNTVAKEATGIASARSMDIEDIETLAGIQDFDKGTNYNQTHNYNYTNHKDQVFVTENGETVKIDSEGKGVTLKHTYYSKELSNDEIGILALGTYWLATPCVECNPNNAYFGVHFVSDGSIGQNHCFYSYGGATSSGRIGVRAVVSVSGL